MVQPARVESLDTSGEVGRDARYGTQDPPSSDAVFFRTPPFLCLHRKDELGGGKRIIKPEDYDYMAGGGEGGSVKKRGGEVVVL